MIYKFKVAEKVYEFEAENAGEAMQMCNRQVMDGLNIGAFAWFDAIEPNVFYCALGNFWD